MQTNEDGRRVRDVFHLTDMSGAPVRDARKLRRLSALVREHVGGVVIAEPGTWDDGHLAALTRTADVLVVAVGYPELVKYASDLWPPGNLLVGKVPSKLLCCPYLSPSDDVCRGDWVKAGAVVLDVGINVVPVEAGQTRQSIRNQSSASGSDERSDPPKKICGKQEEPIKSGDGRVVGDVAFKEVAKLASAITPVPGGVGPMTIAALIHNVVFAAQYRAGLKQW